MTITMQDSMLANMMGFYHLNVKDVPKYIKRRIELDKNIKIGIINTSAEVLPIKKS